MQDVWSQGHVELLGNIMAEDHVQCDVLWSHGVEVTGRDKIAAGIARFREMYPDLAFGLQDVAESGHGRVFLEWQMTGCGPRPIAGVSVCTLRDGKIARTDVYRQATTRELGGWEEWIEKELDAREMAS